MTRNNPMRATDAHVSIVGHISQEELRRELLTTDAASGFANRMLFVCAARSKQLPEGGNLTEEDWRGVVPTLRDALRFASTAGVLKRSPDARELWAEIYGPLSDGKPGMVGAVTSRAEAQVMRLAVIYAALTNHRRFRSSTFERGRRFGTTATRRSNTSSETPWAMRRLT